MLSSCVFGDQKAPRLISTERPSYGESARAFTIVSGTLEINMSRTPSFDKGVTAVSHHIMLSELELALEVTERISPQLSYQPTVGAKSRDSRITEQSSFAPGDRHVVQNICCNKGTSSFNFASGGYSK